MIQTRRSLLKYASIAGTSAALTPNLSLARARSGEVLYESFEDPDLRKLIQASIEAAQAAGASYADVRITHLRRRQCRSGQGFREEEMITAGVRAIVNGYWGFASGPVWDRKELIRLGNEAVQLAEISSGGKIKQASLTLLPSGIDGTWTTPVEIDPYSLHPAQIYDAGNGLIQYARSKPYYNLSTWTFSVTAVDKSFGCSDGAFFSQRTYSSVAAADYSMADGNRRLANFILNERAGAGFEIFDEEKARNEIDRLNALGFSSLLPVIPVDVGRYETVYDGNSVSNILGNTIGCASEIDRALGFEANAGGTSYLNDPHGMVGKYILGSPLLTVEGNRTEAGGLATVKWDDEATPATAFPIIKNGVLQNFQTNRELAPMNMAGRSDVSSGPVSNGCLYAQEAVDSPLIRTPNLRMSPGSEGDADLDALIAGVEKGVLFRGIGANMDFQQLNGMGIGPCFEIRKGRITAQIADAAVLFRAPEFWKSVKKVGGSRSLGRYPFFSNKGEPGQVAPSSITCPPVVCSDQAIIDFRRKA